jgi:hypothetical protein
LKYAISKYAEGVKREPEAEREVVWVRNEKKKRCFSTKEFSERISSSCFNFFRYFF